MRICWGLPKEKRPCCHALMLEGLETCIEHTKYLGIVLCTQTTNPCLPHIEFPALSSHHSKLNKVLKNDARAIA